MQIKILLKRELFAHIHVIFVQANMAMYSTGYQCHHQLWSSSCSSIGRRRPLTLAPVCFYWLLFFFKHFFIFNTLRCYQDHTLFSLPQSQNNKRSGVFVWVCFMREKDIKLGWYERRVLEKLVEGKEYNQNVCYSLFLNQTGWELPYLFLKNKFNYQISLVSSLYSI